MSLNLREEGTALILEAARLLRRDAQGALKDKDFNMAVRRSQEAVELGLKGALKSLGVDYPKAHDVASVFCEQASLKLKRVDHTVLQRIQEASLWLAQARAPSFYFERAYGDEDAQRAVQDATFVLEQLRKMFGIAE